MRRRVLALALLLAPGLACAAGTVITPAPVTGYATLSVLAASLALSGATVGPNSPAFPTGALPQQFLEIKNSPGSASTLYVCPLGGTCTAAVGIPLAVGESKSWMINTPNGTLTSPTVISASTATAVVTW
jgi:hypothetical protein